MASYTSLIPLTALSSCFPCSMSWAVTSAYTSDTVSRWCNPPSPNIFPMPALKDMSKCMPPRHIVTCDLCLPIGWAANNTLVLGFARSLIKASGMLSSGQWYWYFLNTLRYSVAYLSCSHRHQRPLSELSCVWLSPPWLFLDTSSVYLMKLVPLAFVSIFNWLQRTFLCSCPPHRAKLRPIMYSNVFTRLLWIGGSKNPLPPQDFFLLCRYWLHLPLCCSNTGLRPPLHFTIPSVS